MKSADESHTFAIFQLRSILSNFTLTIGNRRHLKSLRGILISQKTTTGTYHRLQIWDPDYSKRPFIFRNELARVWPHITL